MSRHIVAMILAALVAAPCSAAPGASDNPADASMTTHTPLTYNGQPISRWNAPGAATAGSAHELSTVPADAALDVEQPAYGYGRHHRNQAALTAIMLGAVGAIAGTAVLVYANRPDCNVNPNLGGCGYGTKVVGASVLTGGVVGLVAGAVMWR
jgi:hypothetical protein